MKQGHQTPEICAGCDCYECYFDVGLAVSTRSSICQGLCPGCENGDCKAVGECEDSENRKEEQAMDNRYLSRAERLDNGDWVTGYYVRVYGKREKHFIYPGYTEFDADEVFPHKYEIDPSTRGQCTGLTADKSYRGETEQDKLVFEGDIIMCSTWNEPGSMVWEEENLAWIVVSLDGENWDTIWDVDTESLEIIGNVHDNSKLIHPGATP